MIGLAAHDRARAIELFEEYEARDPVRKGHRGERPLVACALQEGLVEPAGTADHDRDPLDPLDLPASERLGERVGGL